MDLVEMHRELLEWARGARAAGWLQSDDLHGLERIERQQADALFENQTHRPLIIGLFGGTGVGKSSLLNRLAGRPIARVGIERPTSHEVTFYLHKDFRLGLLPSDLPLEQTRLEYHEIAGRRLLAWLDMSDMDSTEARNRSLVEAWLPYLDWVVYVVSPERYHDDVGWRFLQERGGRHAWLFVMNQWDRGRPEQLDDFRRRLKGAGFPDPVILRVSCAGLGIADDFARLEETINQAIHAHGIELLRQLGLMSRLAELARQTDILSKRLGGTDEWEQARQSWYLGGESRRDSLRRLLDERARRIAAAFQGRKLNGLELEQQFPQLAQALWTERESDRVGQWIALLAEQLQSAALPVSPYQRLASELPAQAGASVQRAAEESLAYSLAHPGHWLQRVGYRLFGILEWGLPIAVGLWAGQHVFRVYIEALQGRAPFLGLDFAVHSMLMVLLAWAVPWWLHARLKPSPATIIRRGLLKGIAAGLAEVVRLEGPVWADVLVERGRHLAGLAAITQQIPRRDDSPLPGFVLQLGHSNE